MAIWLRRATQAALEGPGVGSDSMVVRAEQFSALVTLDAAFEEADQALDHALEGVHQRAERIRADAQMIAELILDGARGKAAEIDKETRAQFESARQRGYLEGQSQALALWLEQSVRASQASARVVDALKHRVAELVADVLAQTLATVERTSLFARALSCVDGIVEGATYLKLHVASEDFAAASAAAATAEERWRMNGLQVAVRVVSEAQAAPGQCLCESDLGVVEAGLEALLKALREAVTTVATEAFAQDLAHASEACANPSSPASQASGTGDTSAAPPASATPDTAASAAAAFLAPMWPGAPGRSPQESFDMWNEAPSS